MHEIDEEEARVVEILSGAKRTRKFKKSTKKIRTHDIFFLLEKNKVKMFN